MTARKLLNPSLPEGDVEMVLRTFLETEAGRRAACWIVFDLCRIWQPSMQLSIKHELAMNTARNEGIRSVGIALMVKMQEVDPRGYLRMLEEHQRDTERRIMAEDITP